MNPFVFDVIMTLVAGFLDAVGVTYLHGIYVSFMSGNSIGLGIAIVHGRAPVAFPIVSSIARFVVGAFVGSLVAPRRASATMIVLMLEVTMIVFSIFMIGETDGFVALLPVCIAMGMQNAIPRSVSGVAIGRSFVTGELFGVGRALALALQDRSQLKQAAIHGVSWFTIVLGAIGGAAALTRFGLTPCLGAAAVVLLVVMIVDVRAQFSALRRIVEQPPQ